MTILKFTKKPDSLPKLAQIPKEVESGSEGALILSALDYHDIYAAADHRDIFQGKAHHFLAPVLLTDGLYPISAPIQRH